MLPEPCALVARARICHVVELCLPFCVVCDLILVRGACPVQRHLQHLGMGRAAACEVQASLVPTGAEVLGVALPGRGAHRGGRDHALRRPRGRGRPHGRPGWHWRLVLGFWAVCMLKAPD